MKPITTFRPLLMLAALAPAVVPATAAAQPVTAPHQVDAGLSVQILDPEHALDAAQVRAAIGGELHIQIFDQGAFAPSLGRIEIAVEQGEVRIAYHPAAGTTIERVLALPIAPQDRLQLIAFVATNLVRDQATEVIAGLPIIPPVAPVLPPRQPDAVRHMPFSIGLVWPLSLDRIAGERVQIDVGLYGIAGYADSSTVASISGIADVKRNTASGVQIGGVLAAAGNADGLQISGIASFTRRQMHGLQISGVANVAGALDGGQIGTVNLGGDVSGAQIGVVNVARRMKGLQLGVINVSEDGDDAYPIGLINYSRNGQVAVDATVDTSRVSTLSLRHGTKHMHNVWGVGWSPDYDHILVGAGLGIRARLAQAVGLDVDAMHWLTNVWDAETSQIDQIKATVGFPIAKNLELFGGVAANVYISDGMDESDKFHPTNAKRWQATEDTTVVLWPSAFAGIRVRAQ